MLVDEIINSLIDEAKEHKIKEIIVGLRQVLVVLDDARAGVSMTLRGGYSPFSNSTVDLINLARSTNPLQASVGCATINALLSQNGIPVENDDTVEIMDLQPDDRVGIIGNMVPILPRVKEKVKEVVVFEDNPLFGGHDTLPWWAEKLELPLCEAIITTGVAFVNKSVDELLEHSKKARYRAIVGPSTPMSNLLLGPSRFDFVGGVRITNIELAKNIILSGGGTRELKDAFIKTYIARKRENISAIVLSAGASERFGNKPKALLRIKDKTFLDIIIEKLRSVKIDDIVVVVGAHAEEIIDAVKGKNVRTVFNPVWQSGMLSSIITGLDNISNSADAVMIHPVDFPLVKPETYKILVETWLKNKRGIISPAYNGKLGHPVIISRGYIEEVRNAPKDKGARYVIHSYEGKKDLIIVSVDDPFVRKDIDTEEDYKMILDGRIEYE